MGNITYCNECLEQNKRYVEADYKLKGVPSYTVCKTHFDKLPPALKRFMEFFRYGQKQES